MRKRVGDDVKGGGGGQEREEIGGAQKVNEVGIEKDATKNINGKEEERRKAIKRMRRKT